MKSTWIFLKILQLVTNLLASLLETSPLKEDRSRRLVATNLFSKEDYLLICDWWKIWRLFWLALAKINRIPYKMKILTQEHHSSIFGMNLTLFCVPILLFKLFFWISEKNLFWFSLSNQNLANLSQLWKMKPSCENFIVKDD